MQIWPVRMQIQAPTKHMHYTADTINQVTTPGTSIPNPFKNYMYVGTLTEFGHDKTSQQLTFDILDFIRG